ncbi:MAG: hypothetical protein ACHQU0_00550 [Candidatus Paceibacteria bacterium]
MHDMHDAWFFIGVFVFIFLIWAATGGPMHPIAFTGPRLSEPGVLGGGTYLQLPQAAFSVGSSNVSLGSSGSSYTSPVGGTTFGTPSPYRTAVNLNHGINGAGSADPRNEYATISIPQDAGLPIDLSEWTLSSDASGNATNIPKGTEIPTSGVINAAEDIVLKPGMRAIIISGQSPIGASFRENKCIGYFSNFQSFYPTLPQTCPAPSDELASFYGPDYIRDSSCINYVNKLSRCQVALSPPSTLSGTCQSFAIKYFNYNGCVDAHKNDADFLGDTWRIYLGRTTPMWRTQNEVVKLLDVNGKTVDAFSY